MEVEKEWRKDAHTLTELKHFSLRLIVFFLVVSLSFETTLHIFHATLSQSFPFRSAGKSLKKKRVINCLEFNQHTNLLLARCDTHIYPSTENTVWCKRKVSFLAHFARLEEQKRSNRKSLMLQRFLPTTIINRVVNFCWPFVYTPAKDIYFQYDEKCVRILFLFTSIFPSKIYMNYSFVCSSQYIVFNPINWYMLSNDGRRQRKGGLVQNVAKA